MGALGLTRVDAGSDDDRLFVEVVADIRTHFEIEVIVTTSEEGAVTHGVVRVVNCLKDVCIVFIEGVYLFFKRSLEQLPDFPLRLETLLQQLLRLHIFLMHLLPEQIRQLLVQLHRIVVVLVRVDALRDRDHGTGRPRELPAEDIEVHDVEAAGLVAHLDHVSLQVGEGVGDRLSEKNLVFIVIEVVDETQGEVVFEALTQVGGVKVEKVFVGGHSLSGGRGLLLGRGFSRDLVLEILNIVFTASEPLAVVLFFGFNANFHA